MAGKVRTWVWVVVAIVVVGILGVVAMAGLGFYFFSRHIGVGGVVRFNQGTVEIDEEPLTEQPAEWKAGHTIVGGGLRLRF